MQPTGIVLIVLGVLLMGGAAIYDPTIESRIPYDDLLGSYGSDERTVSTYNLGKLQFQALLFQAGIGFFISGTIFAAVGTALGKFFPEAKAPQFSPARVACEWCAQEVIPPNVPCAQRSNDQLRSDAHKVENARCRAQLAERGLFPAEDEPGIGSSAKCR